MYFTPRINDAVRLASRLHRNQVRKDSERTPYISHLVSVAMLIGDITSDEDIIIAGLMHDSLEDVPGYMYEKLIEDCGARVAEIVKHTTEPLDANKAPEDQLPWLTRQEVYLENLKSGSKESALVSVCDKIHNIESLFSDLEKEGWDFLKRFQSSLQNKLWFYEQVHLVVKEKLGEDHIYVKRLSNSIKSLREILKDYEENIQK